MQLRIRLRRSRATLELQFGVCIMPKLERRESDLG
jgi:hypothetical protein